MAIKELIKVKQIPKNPGIYFFENSKNEIIYVGKAKNLQNRLKSYKDVKLNPRILEMTEQAVTVSWVVCSTENSALILESEWIRREQPKYNIKLKNRQSYPSIRIDKAKDNLPSRVSIDWSSSDESYGPYTNVKTHDLIDALTNVYPVRSCKDSIYRKHNVAKRPCELGELGKCPAPCVSLTNTEINESNIVNLKKFLESENNINLTQELIVKMDNYSKAEEFEKAIILRNTLKIFSKISENNGIIKISKNALFVSVIPNDSSTVYGVSVLKIKNKKIIAAYKNVIQAENSNKTETLDQILSVITVDQGVNHFANNIILDCKLMLSSVEYFEIKNNLKKFNINLTKATTQLKNLTLVGQANAKDALDNDQVNFVNKIHSLQELRRVFNLHRSPYRIEGYDISHINGKYPYGSVVVFENATYSKYNNRVISIPERYSQNDLESLKYVLTKRLTGSTLSYENLPDLILIDGGLEQCKIVKNLIDNLNLNIPVVSLAKRLEELFVNGEEEPLILPRNSEALKLLQTVRDASHNLAIAKHRSKRDFIV